MTLTAPPPTTPISRTELLAQRLVVLEAERDQLAAATRREATGDIVDRATDVEASIRLALLDERIAALALEVEASRVDHHTDGLVSLGDTVTLDFGDGAETFVVGTVEEAAVGIDTVTPFSPLGRAIVGSAVGTTVSYSPRSGVMLSAKILAA